MTCVLAIEHENYVYVGADSFVGGESWRDVMDRPKYVTRGKNMLLAFAGGSQVGQILETITKFAPRKPREDDVAYVMRAIVQRIRALHRKHGITEKILEEVSFNGLVVLDHRVYQILPDYSVIRSNHGYAAIGDGEAHALGSLASTEEQPPEVRIEKALKAAMRHGNSVCRPFKTIRMPLAPATGRTRTRSSDDPDPPADPARPRP